MFFSLEETKLSWFENPWLVFPERRFLLLIMIFLMMFQNPLLVYMFFQPGAYGSPLMHITADSLIGIGIYGILCLWLCLLDGLGYHTSKMAIKRAESKKRQLELQETIDFLQSEGHTTFSTDQIVSDNFLSYYDEYGNSYGSVTSWTNFRMKHDPCGDNWAGKITSVPTNVNLFCSQILHITLTNSSFHRLSSSKSLPFPDWCYIGCYNSLFRVF